MLAERTDPNGAFGLLRNMVNYACVNPTNTTETVDSLGGWGIAPSALPRVAGRKARMRQRLVKAKEMYVSAPLGKHRRYG